MAQPGESLDAPVYHALRAFYLLLPPGERKEFTTRFFGGLDSSGQPLHATLCRLLLHGLAGDTEAAHETLEQLLSLAPLWPANENTPDDAVSRYWSFILGTGAQLQHWQLGSLAIFYWEKSLADEALVRLRQASQQPGQVHARLLEIRTRLAALRIARAESEPEVESIVKEYARYASVEGLGPLAESLETMGAYARGIAIYRQLWEQEPASAHALRNLAGACRMANDSETLVTVLERCVNERLYRMNDATHHDLTLQLVDTFLARGEPARALLLLEKGIAENASDSRLLTRLAQLHARAGRRDAAETIYRRLLAGEPINQPLRLALASLLEEENRFPEAIEILEKNTGPDSDARLAILYLKADKKEEAFAALERLPVAQKNATLLLFADTLIRKGERLGARGVLRNALSRNTMEGRTAFPLQARLIEVLAPGEDRSILAREFRRLRRLTGNDPDLFVAYFDLMRLQAPRLGWEPELLRELVADWADGEGALVAGATLLELALLRQDDGSVKSLWVKLLRRPDMNEPVMQRLALLFSRGSHPALATAALEWLARFNPLDSARMLDWARACFKGAGENRGDAAAAFQVLEELNVRSAFNSEVAGEVAKAYLEFGAIERARPLFEQVIAADPVARNFRAYLDFARLHVAERNFVRARQLLQSAFRNPLNRECQEIVELLAAEGLFDERFDEALAQFALDSQRQILTRQALFAFFEKNNAQAEALALVEAHPGMADAAICTRLRQLYKINFEKLAGLFERLRNMHGSVTVSSEELAAVYAGWAEADLNESKTEARLEHLRRANELLPGDFVIAQRLSEGLIGQGQARLAVAVLEKMIAASRVPADQARARVLLSTILH